VIIWVFREPFGLRGQTYVTTSPDTG